MLKSQPSTTVQLSVGLMLGVSFHSMRAVIVCKYQIASVSQLQRRIGRFLFLLAQGALVAAMGDLSFNAMGYIVIFFNDLFTALNGVILKRTSEGERVRGSHVLVSSYRVASHNDDILIPPPAPPPLSCVISPKTHVYVQNTKRAA